MVYDIFPFFNELDVLDIRLHELDGVVDRFVLAEADKTHQNHPKPFYFEQNKQRFEKFADKIIHVKVTDMPDGPDAWVRENHQRNALRRGLAECKADDVIILSDADEIPRAAQVAELRDAPGIKVFAQKFYYYYLNCLDVTETWLGSRMLFFRDLGEPQSKRLAPGTVVNDGGWHFSFLGGTEQV